MDFSEKDSVVTVTSTPTPQAGLVATIILSLIFLASAVVLPGGIRPIAIISAVLFGGIALMGWSLYAVETLTIDLRSKKLDLRRATLFGHRIQNRSHMLADIKQIHCIVTASKSSYPVNLLFETTDNNKLSILGYSAHQPNGKFFQGRGQIREELDSKNLAQKMNLPIEISHYGYVPLADKK